MKPLISVVIPVFNVEKILHYAVDSLLAQDYENVEIILVNDGSSDQSGRVCDEYARKYDNIFAFHKENGGQSSARNLCLKHSRGEYVGFVDSDDWVATDMYSYLYSLLVEHNADVSSIDIQLVGEHNLEIEPSRLSEKVVVKEDVDILRYYMEITTKDDGYSVCRCLFKKQLLEGVAFREGKFYEDIDYKFLVLRNAKKFVDSNLPKYFYLQTQVSMSFAGFKRKEYQLVEASDILFNLCSEIGDKRLIYYAKVKRARTAFSLLARIAYLGFADDSITPTERKKIIRNFTRDLRLNYWFLMASPIPVNRKLMITALAVHFKCLQIPLACYKAIKRKTDYTK